MPELLAADRQSIGDFNVFVVIFFGKISKKFFAAADHVEKTAAGAVIFFVGAEMLGEIIDALGKNCNLNFGGSGVAFKTCEFGDDSGFDVFFHN